MRIGMVTQNIQLFHATVRENLTFFEQPHRTRKSSRPSKTSAWEIGSVRFQTAWIPNSNPEVEGYRRVKPSSWHSPASSCVTPA